MLSMQERPPPRTLLGVALVIVAVTEFAWLDACMRWVSPRVSLPIALLMRYAIQALFMAAWIAWVGRHGGAPGFRTAHPRFQWLRGVLLLVSSTLMFAAIRVMPLAEATAITLLGPVLVTLLAAWVLHERVTRAQMLLMGVCFAGALIVVRPGSGIFGWAALLPLATAFSYAVFNLLSGRLAHLESPLTTNFYTGIVGTALMLIVWTVGAFAGFGEVLGHPTSINAADLLVLVIGSLLGTTGHLVLIHAMRHAPTSTLMPFTYLQIPSSTLAGYLLWRHMPDAWAFTGMAIIAASGALLVWLNFRRLP
jgi:drug/metabolite transporter (DMT)-like permease